MSPPRRCPHNPILTRDDVPAAAPHLVDVSSVFNPGAVHREGRDRLLLRVQTRGRQTVLMPADETEPGSLRFRVRPVVTEIIGLDVAARGIHHVYDPRLTVLDDTLYMVFAADTDDGCRLGIAHATGDLDRFELVSYDDAGDRRNGVLFPERVGGRVLRLERPNAPDVVAGAPPSGDHIVLADSDDLVTWRVVGPVMQGRPRAWDERIGSGPPPVRTADGWLHVYHGVATHFASCNIYQTGVVLLDHDDPTRVIARGRLNVLEPRETYELIGQVPNVVFPSGMTVDQGDDRDAPRDAAVRLYYGAADTCVAAATCTIGDLLDACADGG